jgi:hypothetical protein
LQSVFATRSLPRRPRVIALVKGAPETRRYEIGLIVANYQGHGSGEDANQHRDGDAGAVMIGPTARADADKTGQGIDRQIEQKPAAKGEGGDGENESLRQCCKSAAKMMHCGHTPFHALRAAPTCHVPLRLCPAGRRCLLPQR